MSYFGYVKQINAKQTGMVFRFVKKGDVFIHTTCEGELLKDLGFSSEDINGKTLHDFFPKDYADIKNQCYLEAWSGNAIQYETEIQGILMVASLRPVIKDGQVVEVAGISIDVTEKRIKSSEVSQKDSLRQTIISEACELQREARIKSQDRDKADAPFKSSLIIKQYNKIIFIPLKDVIFIERIGRKSVIHTINKQIETSEALNSLIQQLDERFVGCHRSYIINLDYLEVIEPSNQSYTMHFKNYTKTAKISKNKIGGLLKYIS
ncbi:PAS domain-containing transcriptional regulator [Neobacillus terrae]|uniref:PAS domain-containing transcriptional regulator n=1 Tax=Neobacillus terrae TaxID=3034837 RepID=UPI0014079FD3|nr:PAS domain-containing transcriptional regulator [Neobacillus terrae]NHM32405.1 PAS domain-containing protein [Neobacillus terrae]